MGKQDDSRLKKEFLALQNRQIVAIAITLFVVLLCAVLYKRPGLLGDFSKASLMKTQGLNILAFIIFTVLNWRCPSCKRYLGSDIHRSRCKKCGVKFR